ncbi:MAG: hypothetical protein HN350_14770 [Phycisphaerales bacterium]|nr:hypothetical protein [Phycisphaerales bacterium]
MKTIENDTRDETPTRQPDASSEAKLKLIAEARKYRKRAQEAERLLNELSDQHSGAIAESNARATRLGEMLSGVVVTDRLKSALASRGVKRVDQAAGLLAGQLDVNITDDGYSVTVGGESQASGADEETVEQVVDRWLADNRHYLPPSGDTGSGAYPGLTSSGGVSIEQLDRNPARKADFVARHGPAALVQLAHRGRKTPRR